MSSRPQGPDLSALSVEELVDYVAGRPEALALVDPKLRGRLADAVRVAGSTRVRLPDLRIRTKDAQLRPLAPNAAQTRLLEMWRASYHGFDWAQGCWLGLRGARETILKARQEGVSTLVEGVAYLLSTTTPHWVSVIIADTQERAEMLFEIIRRYHQNDTRKVRTSLNSVRCLAFPDLDSSIRVSTAGDANVGRAATINFLHMSELAFWGDNWNVRGALLDAVPLKTGIVIEETTANGMNEYYEHWVQCEAGLTNFKARFLPWYELPEYRIGFTGDPTYEELDVMARFPVDAAQARWYTTKRREKSTTDVQMEQEYPGTPEEAFVSSASGAVFPPDEIRRQMGAAPDPARVLRPGDSGFGGRLEIWEEPQIKGEYVCGVDVAEGIDDRGDHDYSTIDVFDANTWTHVASYAGRPDIERFANDCDAVSAHYNNAVLVVERNNHGHAVILQLNQLGANVFAYKAHRERGAIDGFPTTAKTKAMRDAALKSALEAESQGDPGVTLRGKRALKEMLTYHELPGKRRGAVGKKAHDDHVSSVGMAVWYLSEFLPKVRPYTKEKSEAWGGYQPTFGRRMAAQGGRTR